MSLTDERILEILDTVEPGCVRLPLGWKLFAKAIEAEVTKTEVTMESLAFPYATLKATKPQELVAWKGLSDVQWMNIVNHDSCYLNQDKEDAVHLAVKLTEARLKGNNTTPQPCPKCREWENKYLMEQAVNAGDDVLLSENERLKAKCTDLEALITVENQRKQQLEAELLNKEGMTCGDCNDTGWLENRVEGRYPCTCMTEAEPYQILQAKCAELEQQNALYQDEVEQLETDFNAQEVRMHEVRKERDALAMQNQQMREALTLWKIASDNSEEVEFDEMAAYSIPMPLFCDADEATEAALVLPDNTEAIIKRNDSAIREEMIDLFRLKHRDYANELAAELDGKS